jgi:anti-sigma B factor antagonist
MIDEGRVPGSSGRLTHARGARTYIPQVVEREPTRIDAQGLRPPPAFALEEEHRGGAVVLRLSGEVDVAASGAVRARVDGAAAGPFVVDLSGVSFVDSSGLRELLRARMECERLGGRLVLACVPPVLDRLLDLTGTTAMFVVEPTVEAALARIAGEPA